MPISTIPRKLQQSPNKIKGPSSYSDMGYTWDSLLTDEIGKYRVWVKFRGKKIYDEITETWSCYWVIEEHIKERIKRGERKYKC